MIKTEVALRALRIKHERELRALRKEFSTRAQEVAAGLVDENGDMPFALLPELRRRMAPLYDEFYGRYNGDEEARFYQLVVTQARESYRLAGAIQRSLVATIVDGRVDLPFDKNGRERANA